MSDSNLEQWIADWLDGRITPADSELLQQRLRESPAARARFLEYTKVDSAMREFAGDQLTDTPLSELLGGELSETNDPVSRGDRSPTFKLVLQLATAAIVLFMVSGIAYWLGKRDAPQVSTPMAAQEQEPAEETIAGHATLRRGADIRWTLDGKSYRTGDVLPAGVLEFEDGVAEIDFFCGATVVVEGPAKMDLESDWSVRFLAGRLRANVPPAARGFIVKAADSEIVDLGTEFALEVGPERTRVEVVDGEVKLRGGAYDGDHLVTGQGKSLIGDDGNVEKIKGLSTVVDVQLRHELGQRERLAQWRAYARTLRDDERLITYYPIAESTAERFVPNAAATGKERDGKLVGSVRRTDGRFGIKSTGLEFDRPGARVRTRIDGEFQAFTFVAWVKIDSLDHVYNALFMSDGYENGEPHWQIREDGRLMFSVMVDDKQDVRVPSRIDQKIVKDAGLHRVYFTEPIWDISKSGQWMHVAAVYDPASRRVVQYVNGEQVSSESIIDRFHITTLRIGPAEIGNWGQPFRESPWFAVRNLNGAIDELAIFKAALSAQEMKDLYENGKPLEY